MHLVNFKSYITLEITCRVIRLYQFRKYSRLKNNSWEDYIVIDFVGKNAWYFYWYLKKGYLFNRLKVVSFITSINRRQSWVLDKVICPRFQIILIIIDVSIFTPCRQIAYSYKQTFCSGRGHSISFYLQETQHHLYCSIEPEAESSPVCPGVRTHLQNWLIRLTTIHPPVFQAHLWLIQSARDNSNICFCYSFLILPTSRGWNIDGMTQRLDIFTSDNFDLTLVV